MRLLKMKIRKAQEARLNKSIPKQSIYDFKDTCIQLKSEQASSPVTTSTTVCSSPCLTPPVTIKLQHQQPKKRKRSPLAGSPKRTEKSTQCTKNIVINYGKAIASFAASDLAIPYLKSIVHKEGISVADFAVFIRQAKDSIGGIDSFRSLLLVAENDDEKTVGLKNTLRQIGEIFIKYFSVNWICNGRVTHKMIYLKYRNKMLRRIQNPEYFTYVREHKKKKSSK